MALADYRKAAGFKTQMSFAGAIGVPRTAVAKWETGYSFPRPELLPLIAQKLNRSVEEVIVSIQTARAARETTQETA